MATKRSDFAQKLLDDLRLRKERMAASQNSNRSKTTTIDAYAYSKQIHRGSKNTRTNGSSVPKATNARYGGSSKSLKIEDNSNQLVPYNGSRNSVQIGDLSMALAFALENGGKLRRSNTSSGNNLMLGFLHQISRGSFEIGKMNKRSGLDRLHGTSGYFPTISHLHIKEISKGAQKLNQILRTCSNGLNFGKCSIEIGQELLKGAKDLEESLRMLVNLHEASEHMISPQQKNRIVLLEDEDVEENEVETPDQKQLYQPQFSWDKFSLNSRSSREVKGNGLEQKLATLRYSAERGNFNHEEQPLTTLKSSSHRRSASYGGNDVKTSSPPGKVGISNVIAKLMGLDNLADKSNSTRLDSGPKQKVTQKDIQPTARGSTRKVEPKTIIKEGRFNPKNLRLIESDKNSAVVNPMFGSQGMYKNNFPTNDAHLQTIDIGGKPSWKAIEGIRPKTSPSTIPIFKQQQNKDEMRQRVTSQKDYQEGITKTLHLKHREPKAISRDENKGVIKSGIQHKDYFEGNAKQQHLKHREPKTTEWDEKRRLIGGIQKTEAEMHKKSESAIILEGDKERTLKLEKAYSNKLQSSRQQKILSSPGYQQPLMLHKAAGGEIKHHGDEKKQKSRKQRVQERNQKGSATTSKILIKPTHEALTLSKKQQDMNRVRQSEKSYKETVVTHQSNMTPNNRCPEDMPRENACYDQNDKPDDITYKSREQNSSSRDSETKFGKEDLLIRPVLEKQHANVPVQNDVKSTRMQESEGPKNINEVFPNKQKTPMFQEVEQNRHDKLDVFDGPKLLGADGSEELEAHIIESKKTVVSVQQPNSTQNPHKETKKDMATSYPTEDQSNTLKEAKISALNDGCQKTIVTSSSNQEDQIADFGRVEVNSSKIVTKTVKGAEAGKYDNGIFYPQHLEHLHNFSKSRKRETLTESENHLKQRLITSERFLNAAEALFKLNIPSFILHDSGHIHQKDGRNLIIDCSYEVMKRKGIRQELNNHPCTNISKRSKKIEALDDLIKQLHKDFEALKFYGRKGRIECELQFYLPKMLEIDIYNKEPELNSMWDLGWNDTEFVFLEKEEVVREVEKRVLCGLLDEVFRDLLHV